MIREEGAITPAAEWFVDNFHIVEDVLREVREDLPPGFYRRLPKLAEGPLEGYPRVLGLAWPFVAHSDSRFEPETLQRFVQRFQRVQALTIGELWAVPIALRLVLLENLRRLAEQIVNGRAARRDGGRARERIARARRGAGAPSGLSAARGRCPADGLHRAARPAPAGAGSRVDTGARMAQRTAVRPGHVARRARASGASAPGGDERDGPQRDYQHADDVDVRLGGVLRKRQSGRCRAARRERLRRDGLQDARPIPSRDRGPRSRFPADGHRRRPGGDRSSERAPRRSGSRRAPPADPGSRILATT